MSDDITAASLNIAFGQSGAEALQRQMQEMRMQFDMTRRQAVQFYSDTERLVASMSALSAKTLLVSNTTQDMIVAMRMAQPMAKEMLKWTRDLAVYSPFGQAGVSGAYKTAQMFGFTAKESKRAVQSMVDLAAATGQTEDVINRALYALGQMKSAGKVLGQDMMQLMNANVPAWEYLAKGIKKAGTEAHYTIGEIKQLQQAGKLSSKKAVEAILAGIERDFAGAAKRQSGTIAGLINSWEDLTRYANEYMTADTVKALQPLFQQAVDMLGTEENIRKMREYGAMFGSMAERSKQFAEAQARTFPVFLRDIKPSMQALADMGDVVADNWQGMALAGAALTATFMPMHAAAALVVGKVGEMRGWFDLEDGAVDLAQAIKDLTPILAGFGTAWATTRIPNLIDQMSRWTASVKEGRQAWSAWVRDVPRESLERVWGSRGSGDPLLPGSATPLDHRIQQLRQEVGEEKRAELELTHLLQQREQYQTTQGHMSGPGIPANVYGAGYEPRPIPGSPERRQKAERRLQELLQQRDLAQPDEHPHYDQLIARQEAYLRHSIGAYDQMGQPGIDHKKTQRLLGYLPTMPLEGTRRDLFRTVLDANAYVPPIQQPRGIPGFTPGLQRQPADIAEAMTRELVRLRQMGLTFPMGIGTHQSTEAYGLTGGRFRDIVSVLEWDRYQQTRSQLRGEEEPHTRSLSDREHLLRVLRHEVGEAVGHQLLMDPNKRVTALTQSIMRQPQPYISGIGAQRGSEYLAELFAETTAPGYQWGTHQRDRLLWDALHAGGLTQPGTTFEKLGSPDRRIEQAKERIRQHGYPTGTKADPYKDWRFVQEWFEPARTYEEFEQRMDMAGSLPAYDGGPRFPDYRENMPFLNSLLAAQEREFARGFHIGVPIQEIRPGTLPETYANFGKAFGLFSKGEKEFPHQFIGFPHPRRYESGGFAQTFESPGDILRHESLHWLVNKGRPVLPTLLDQTIATVPRKRDFYLSGNQWVSGGNLEEVAAQIWAFGRAAGTSDQPGHKELFTLLQRYGTVPLGAYDLMGTPGYQHQPGQQRFINQMGRLGVQVDPTGLSGWTPSQLQRLVEAEERLQQLGLTQGVKLGHATTGTEAHRVLTNPRSPGVAAFENEERKIWMLSKQEYDQMNAVIDNKITPEQVYLHERGHSIHQAIRGTAYEQRIMPLLPEKPVSQQAMFNERERFAETMRVAIETGFKKSKLVPNAEAIRAVLVEAGQVTPSYQRQPDGAGLDRYGPLNERLTGTKTAEELHAAQQKAAFSAQDFRRELVQNNTVIGQLKQAVGQAAEGTAYLAGAGFSQASAAARTMGRSVKMAGMEALAMFGVISPVTAAIVGIPLLIGAATAAWTVYRQRINETTEAILEHDEAYQKIGKSIEQANQLQTDAERRQMDWHWGLVEMRPVVQAQTEKLSTILQDGKSKDSKEYQEALQELKKTLAEVNKIDQRKAHSEQLASVVRERESEAKRREDEREVVVEDIVSYVDQPTGFMGEKIPQWQRPWYQSPFPEDMRPEEKEALAIKLLKDQIAKDEANLQKYQGFEQEKQQQLPGFLRQENFPDWLRTDKQLESGELGKRIERGEELLTAWEQSGAAIADATKSVDEANEGLKTFNTSVDKLDHLHREELRVQLERADKILKAEEGFALQETDWYSKALELETQFVKDEQERQRKHRVFHATDEATVGRPEDYAINESRSPNLERQKRRKMADLYWQTILKPRRELEWKQQWELVDFERQTQDRRIDQERDFLRKREDMQRDFSRQIEDFERQTVRAVEDMERDFLRKREDSYRQTVREFERTGFRDWLGGAVDLDTQTHTDQQRRLEEHNRQLELLRKQDTKCAIDEADKKFKRQERQAAEAYAEAERQQQEHQARMLAEYTQSRLLQQGVDAETVVEAKNRIFESLGVTKSAAEEMYDAGLIGITKWTEGEISFDQAMSGIDRVRDKAFERSARIAEERRKQEKQLAKDYVEGAFGEYGDTKSQIAYRKRIDELNRRLAQKSRLSSPRTSFDEMAIDEQWQREDAVLARQREYEDMLLGQQRQWQDLPLQEARMREDFELSVNRQRIDKLQEMERQRRESEIQNERNLWQQLVDIVGVEGASLNEARNWFYQDWTNSHKSWLDQQTIEEATQLEQQRLKAAEEYQNKKTALDEQLVAMSEAFQEYVAENMYQDAVREAGRDVAAQQAARQATNDYITAIEQADGDQQKIAEAQAKHMGTLNQMTKDAATRKQEQEAEDHARALDRQRGRAEAEFVIENQKDWRIDTERQLRELYEKGLNQKTMTDLEGRYEAVKTQYDEYLRYTTNPRPAGVSSEVWLQQAEDARKQAVAMSTDLDSRMRLTQALMSNTGLTERYATPRDSTGYTYGQANSPWLSGKSLLEMSKENPMNVFVTGMAFPGFGGGRASGGPVLGAQAYVVGEDGPEFFFPKVAGYVMPTPMTQEMLKWHQQAQHGTLYNTEPGGRTRVALSPHTRRRGAILTRIEQDGPREKRIVIRLEGSAQGLSNDQVQMLGGAIRQAVRDELREQTDEVVVNGII